MNSTSTKSSSTDNSSVDRSIIFTIEKTKKSKEIFKDLSIPPFEIGNNENVKSTLPKINFDFFNKNNYSLKNGNYQIKSSLF